MRADGAFSAPDSHCRFGLLPVICLTKFARTAEVSIPPMTGAVTAMAKKSLNPLDHTQDFEKLLKGCRRDGGNPVIGRISQQVNGRERVLLIILADASPFHFKSLTDLHFALAEYLHVDKVKIQSEIKDPLVAEGIRLGGRVIGWGQ